MSDDFEMIPDRPRVDLGKQVKARGPRTALEGADGGIWKPSRSSFPARGRSQRDAGRPRSIGWTAEVLEARELAREGSGARANIVSGKGRSLGR